MSQRDLANAMGRSVSWVSQVERGIQPLERLSILRKLAGILVVEVADLRPEAEGAAQEKKSSPKPNDLEHLRCLLSGHPSIDISLQPCEEVRLTAQEIEDLSEQVDLAWKYTHSNEFANLSQHLESCLPNLEQAVRASTAESVVALCTLCSRIYFAIAAAFARQHEADAAWVAADRGIRYAERGSNPLEIAAGHFRLSHVFIQLGQFSQAEYVCSGAIRALKKHPDISRRDRPSLSLLGAVYLARALAHAREDNREAAKRDLDQAKQIAQQIGEDRNDFNTEFGPTNVELHRVTIALELGDAGEALDVGKKIDPSNLSIERQARFLVDLARANTLRGFYAEASQQLLEAERLAPEYILSHHQVHDLVKILIQMGHHLANKLLYGFAERCGQI